MSTVSEILNTNIPSPIDSYRPSLVGPPSFNFNRGSKSYRFDPRTEIYNRVNTDAVAVGGYETAATIQKAESTVLNEGPHNIGAYWNTSNTSVNPSFSWFQNPNKVDSETYHDTASRLISPAGTEDAGTKTLYFIFEKGSSNTTGIGVKINRSSYAKCTIAEYDWGDDSTAITRQDGASINWVYANRFDTDGPSGGPIVEMWMQYTPDSAYEGNDRDVLFIPTLNGSTSQNSILHYGGLYDHVSAGPPIRSGNSTSTRSYDDLSVSIDAGTSFHVTLDLEVVGHDLRRGIDTLIVPGDGQLGLIGDVPFDLVFQHGGSNERFGSITPHERIFVTLGRSRDETILSKGQNVRTTDSQSFGGSTNLTFGGGATIKVYGINVYPRKLTADEIQTLAARP
jgi:hypothetical protein